MAKNIQTNILNYRVIIERTVSPKGKVVYEASCPTLGVFDYGENIESVMKGIRDGIESVIDLLTEENCEIPADHVSESLITFAEVSVSPKSAKLAVI